MKLVFCKTCNDMFSLRDGEPRTCWCGESAGRYLAGGAGIYSGAAAIPICFGAGELRRAIRERADLGSGQRFAVWVVARQSQSFTRADTAIGRGRA